MRFQVTLTVPEGKRLIARAVRRLLEQGGVLEAGSVLLLGGTTVSAVAEELGYGPLWISGRICPTGCRTAFGLPDVPHNLFVRAGRARGVDDRELEAVALGLGPGDSVVCGANALDPAGRAALALAAPGGGIRGRVLKLLASGRASLIIACGLEKLIPTPVGEAIRRAGRNTTEVAMGAAFDLLPLEGKVITELEAFEILYGVSAGVIAGGGIQGAEGARTFVLEGAPEEIRRAGRDLTSLKGAATSGAPGSMEVCRPGCRHCSRHAGCAYLDRSKAYQAGLAGPSDS